MDKKPNALPGYAEEQSSNSSNNPYIGDILKARLPRRSVLLGGLSATTAAIFGGASLVGCSDDNNNNNTMPQANPGPAPAALGFTAVAKSLADRVAVPTGYSARVVYALGDPIAAGVSAYSNAGIDADFDKRSGDHHDGMYFFGLDAAGQYDPMASDRGLLVINHENITESYLHVAGPTSVNGARPQAEVDKEMNAHGVAVVELVKTNGTWSVVQNSGFNRRITPFTEMELRGPVRGSRFAKTLFSSGATRTRGTFNNCANGYTPWGTYLACEENWAFYFRRASGDDANRVSEDNGLLARYGIRPGNSGNYGWTTVDGDAYKRLDITVDTAAAADGSGDYRNEQNTYGYVVEIDPFQPTSTPRKRTMLGRIAHEGAWVGPVNAGEPIVFYTGDDSRFEYMYKFVSARNWDPADAAGGLAAGDKYLDEGTLYVARFNADGSGEWIALAHGSNGLNEDNALYPFTSQAAVLVATRLAADSVGATRMDRPEWAAVNPHNGEVYLTLTNNTRRTAAGSTDAANPRNYDADTGNTDASLNGNVNGHIIRWREDSGMAAAVTFVWDIYAFGSRASYPAVTNVSGLTDANDFSSPDGLWFDDRGILWIQTDDGAYTQPTANDTAATNCMLLAAVPGSVGDGGARTIGTQGTLVGANPTEVNLRRFLVGPAECEITGIFLTADHKSLFVNIQHPGEDGDGASPTSHWPNANGDATVAGAAGARPRSATIVITRNDGGDIAV